jgi:hypothetical protein
VNREEYIEYYRNLLIRQYRSRPRARATLTWALDRKARMFELARQLKSVYDIDSASAEQLTVVGKYVGVERNFDDYGILLNDEELRFFVKIKIAANSSLYSEGVFSEAINALFRGTMTVYNNLDMTLAYWLHRPVPQRIVEVLRADRNILPAPATMNVNYILDNTSDVLFGFCSIRAGTAAILYFPSIIGFSGLSLAREGTFLDIGSIIQ